MRRPVAGQFTRDTVARSQDAYRLDRILAALERSQDHLIPALCDMLPEVLSGERDGQPLTTRVLTYELHEAYHAGRLELLCS